MFSVPVGLVYQLV